MKAVPYCSRTRVISRVLEDYIHTDVHETISDWMDKPIEELAGKRAIAITVSGTTIDGELEYRMEKTEDGLRVESLNFVNLPQYVVVCLNGGGNHLADTLFKSLNILA